MNNLINSSYDTKAIIIAVILTTLVYLYYGKTPKRFYKTVGGLRLVQQSELDSLHRQINALTDQINMLQNTPIKKDVNGQLSFVQDTERTRTIKLPFRKNDENGVPRLWYQVWRTADKAHWDNNEILVERTEGKKRYTIWVTELEKGDVKIQPFRWELAKEN